MANPYVVHPGRYVPRRRSPALRALIFVFETVSWIIAGVALGCFAYIHANAYFFQLDQNRRMDALLKRRATDVAAAPAAGEPNLPAVNSPLASASTALAGAGATYTSTPENLPESTYYASPGDLIGRIEIPHLKVSAVIVEGVDQKSLERAVGHIPGTALPGNPGNIALAGHRDSFFRKIGQLHDGDEILLQTTHGNFRYHVKHIGIVTPQDLSVLEPSKDPALTLVTCFPFRFVGPAPDRYIVTAR